jgi:hypothetical protein
MKTATTNGSEDGGSLPLTGPTLPSNITILKETNFNKRPSYWFDQMDAPTHLRTKGNAAVKREVARIADSGKLSHEQASAVIAVIVDGQPADAKLYFHLTAACAKIKKEQIFRSLKQRDLSDPTFEMPKTERHYVPEKVREPKPKAYTPRTKASAPKAAKEAPSAPTLTRFKLPESFQAWPTLKLRDQIRLLSDKALQDEVSYIYRKALLSDAETLVLNLYTLGKTKEEIADNCDIPEVGVLARTQSAMTKIGACLELEARG